MKIKLLSLVIIFAFLLNCVSVYHERAKIYVSGLVPMIDAGTDEVLSKVEDEWEFQCNKFWTKKDPTLKDVSKEIKGRIAFTKEEKIQIFSQKGEYKVMIFSKFLEDDIFSNETIGSTGYTMDYTAGQKYKDKRYTCIKVVFRDNKLVHFKVWPYL